MSYKLCRSCNINKHENDFAFDQRYRRRDGRGIHCRKCVNEKKRKKYSPKFQKERLLKDRYGLSLTEHNKIMSTQENRCAICLRKKKLFVDHCHSSLKVRGMLCQKCNSALGYLFDSVLLFKNAIEYLIRHKR